MTGQAHPGNHVDFVETRPLTVRSVEEIHLFENTQVVHQNVCLWLGGKQMFSALGGAQVGSQATQLRAWHALANARQRLVDLGRVTTDHHHRRAAFSQCLADPQANAGRAAADNGEFSRQIDLHAQTPAMGRKQLRLQVAWIGCVTT
ncbi:hypothetical protein D3C73_779900 [compost metagenome]